MKWRLVIAPLCLGTLIGCNCPVGDRPATPEQTLAHPDTRDPGDRASSLLPPPREPGPPRLETAPQVERALDESRSLVNALKGNISSREIASMADIRGYRFYRVRYFRRAQVWFEAAVSADPAYEPALFNATRVAALLKQTALARKHMSRLRGIDTPLSRSRLQLLVRDPELDLR